MEGNHFLAEFCKFLIKGGYCYAGLCWRGGNCGWTRVASGGAVSGIQRYGSSLSGANGIFI
eukprot:11762858-Ditylum_brightwellii.AAC.1